MCVALALRLPLTLMPTGSVASRASQVVIGAGVAGLRTAKTLHDAGDVVQVLEGRGRLGGRVLVHREPGRNGVNLGANYVHGCDVDGGNVVFNLAEEQGFPLAHAEYSREL